MNPYVGALFGLALLLPTASWAEDLEDLCLDGYGVAEKTRLVDQSFSGCEVGKIIAFVDGYGMKCEENYNVSLHNPNVYILENIRDHDNRIVIGDHAYRATLGRVSR